ncbi:MAG: hypothetical protein WBF34_05905 [Streptosporangiaceae bacterium]
MQAGRPELGDDDAILPGAFRFDAAQDRFPEAAGEALRVPPDPVEDDQIAAFLAPYGITLGELESRIGGSP